MPLIYEILLNCKGGCLKNERTIWIGQKKTPSSAERIWENFFSFHLWLGIGKTGLSLPSATTLGHCTDQISSKSWEPVQILPENGLHSQMRGDVTWNLSENCHRDDQERSRGALPFPELPAFGNSLPDRAECPGGCRPPV